MTTIPGFALGVYEKALPNYKDLPARLATAAKLGFDYLEMSIDPSEERLSRLSWSRDKRREIYHIMEDTNLPIRSICLSAHRRYPLGSSSSAEREKSLRIMREAIDLASDLGVRIIQVAGYDTYGEPSNENSCQRYLEGVQQAVSWASEKVILLGLENQEKGFVDSPTTAVEVIRKIGSPYLGLYMDVGNLIVKQHDLLAEIEAAGGYLLAVHVKDARPGEPRHVPFGEGGVPFDRVFNKLIAIGFRGPITIEMWNEDLVDAEVISSKARDWIYQRLESAWLASESILKN